MVVLYISLYPPPAAASFGCMSQRVCPAVRIWFGYPSIMCPLAYPIFWYDALLGGQICRIPLYTLTVCFEIRQTTLFSGASPRFCAEMSWGPWVGKSR